MIADSLPFTLTITIGAGAVIALAAILTKYLIDRRKKNGG